MKKKLIILFLTVFFMTGCFNKGKSDVVKELSKKVDGINSYYIKGELEIINNEDSYLYDVEVSYKKEDNFKVDLINKTNNHEQIILKNADGVYLLTPSLNKSFKFQSDWPHNNSQIYLLKSVIDDLNNDQTTEKQVSDDKYIFTSKVNYPNNNALVKQKVTVTNDLTIQKVEVLNDKDEAEMTFVITSIDYDPTFDEAYFEVNSIINTKPNTDNLKENDNKDNKTTDENKTTDNKEDKKNITDSNKTSKTATLDDIVYPLYLPTGTVLEGQEKVSKTDGERVILTFTGDKSFTLVEETVDALDELTIIPTYGEPSFINDTIGAITDNSLNWTSNGIEYYIVSDVMNKEELLNVAKSIDIKAVSNMK